MKFGVISRIELFYVVLQLLIGVKCLFFFFFYGRGRAMPFSLFDFPSDALFFDFVFHELMHVLIGLLALVYGMNVPEFRVGFLLPRIFFAVFIHNFFYWLTNVHPSVIYSVIDFGSDSVILLSFVFTGFLLGKWNKLKAFKVPFF
jgi:hypothetical protein